MSRIINNTVLSNLAYVDRLDMLKDVFGKVYLTPEVYDEVDNGIRFGRHYQIHTKRAVDAQTWLFITNLEKRELKLFDQLKSRIDVGEASCIAVAKERNWLFLTDDKNARKVAERYNIELSGTVGFLRVAVVKNLISKDEGNVLLRAMIDNGYFSPVSNLSDIF
jgi:predicted nucleic acid-binding protein